MRARLITDATYRSQKIRTIQPLEWRPEYAWLLPIAEDNGVFEFDVPAIWAEAYGVARPDWTIAKVSQLLDELVRVGLIQRYEHEGKLYGCFTKAALPPPSKRFSKLPNAPVTQQYRDGTAKVPEAYRKATPDYGLDFDDVGESGLGIAGESNPPTRSLASLDTPSEKTEDTDHQFKDGTPFPPNWDSLSADAKKQLLAKHRVQAAPEPVQDDQQLPDWLTGEEDSQ